MLFRARMSLGVTDEGLRLAPIIEQERNVVFTCHLGCLRGRRSFELDVKRIRFFHEVGCKKALIFE